MLITGAGRGIGAACVELFARSGATVAIHYRTDAEAAGRALESASHLSPGDHFLIAADLAEPAGPDRLLAAVRERWGRLDCLVNNAGVWLESPLESVDTSTLDSTWRLNLYAPFLCARGALDLLAASRDGNIVNVSSTAGQRGEAGYSAYAASKGALIAATKSWSTELAPKIRVNAVAPGWVDTDMCAEVFSEGGEGRIAATIPRGRVASAAEIAGPILFLASPLSRHITGEVLNVNGGSVLAG